MKNASKILDFFEREIDPEAVALLIRKLNHIVMLEKLVKVDKTNEIMDVYTITNAVFWLNALAEVLDPYLEKE